MKKPVRWVHILLGGSFFLLATAGFAGPKYFKDSYETLQLKACTLQAHGSLAAFNSNDATIKTIAQAKTGMLENFYAMASTYGKNDVDGASTVLKNEARLNWDIKQVKKPQAQEALYSSEAAIKYFFEKDKAPGDANRPALAGDFKTKVPALVVQAEAAFAAGNYAKMRKVFYHALWLSYPVTSKAAFVEPK
jgi:hypothetical protein